MDSLSPFKKSGSRNTISNRRVTVARIIANNGPLYARVIAVRPINSITKLV